MDINTNDFKLTEENYFKTRLLDTLKRQSWFVVIVIIAVLYWANLWLLILLAVYSAVMAMEIAFSLNADELKPLFKDKFCRITDEYLVVHFKDGDLQKISWGNITRVGKTKDAYYLYLSKKNFIYLPLKAFGFPEDQKAFQTFLQTKKFLKS